MPLCEELCPAPLRCRERDVNEGAWPGTASQPAPEPRLAAARRKNDVMQMKGRVYEARVPPPPFGVSVPVFSSGESQTGFHRESLQITSILARRKQNLHPAGSTPSLFLPLLSFSLYLSPPLPFSLPFPPPQSPSLVYLSTATSVLIYTHRRKETSLVGREGGKKKRERKKLAWLWKMTLEVAKPAARVESIVS